VSLPPVADFEAQVRDVFASIDKTLKAQVGSLKDMVTMTVFITEARNGDRFVAIRKAARSNAGRSYCVFPVVHLLLQDQLLHPPIGSLCDIDLLVRRAGERMRAGELLELSS
jgi:enamine deaminase RidA (YjgF/YER057c/UK114 family)